MDSWSRVLEFLWLALLAWLVVAARGSGSARMIRPLAIIAIAWPADENVAPILVMPTPRG